MPSGSGGCSNVNIISRSQWGARNPKHVTAMHVPVHEFFIHHTESPSCSSQSECSARVRGIQNYHMDSRGWSDIGYSFLVGEDGNVYEGRGWTHVGAHTAGYNSKAFAASMIGSYMSHLPNSKALAAVKNLIACGVHLGKISANYRLYGLLLKPYDEFAAHMYQKSDTNKDGILTVTEIEDEFRQYDANHDGHISRHEYTSFICFLQPALYQLSHYLYDQYDLSPTDHQLQITDFEAFHAKLDSNGDANLTQTEWVTWWVKTFQGLETANHHIHGLN